MNYLLAGHEVEGDIRDLVSLTKITSENTIKALILRFVNGVDVPIVCATYSIDKSNFRRATDKINEKASIVERIKERQWPEYQEFVKYKKSQQEAA